MPGRITINSHSSIRIESGKVLRFDPFRIAQETHDADIVFITHSHFDHFSPEDIEKIAKDDTVFVIPETMKEDAVNAGISEENCIMMRPGQVADVFDIVVEAVPSYNIGKPMHPKANGWLGYSVTVDGTRIYVGGDMDATPEAAFLACDIAMIPIGGTYTMNPEEGVELINEMKPKIVIPTHYGSIVGTAEDGEKFAKLVDEGIEVVLKL